MLSTLIFFYNRKIESFNIFSIESTTLEKMQNFKFAYEKEIIPLDRSQKSIYKTSKQVVSIS